MAINQNNPISYCHNGIFTSVWEGFSLQLMLYNIRTVFRTLFWLILGGFLIVRLEMIPIAVSEFHHG
jgi:hypothetical protein